MKATLEALFPFALTFIFFLTSLLALHTSLAVADTAVSVEKKEVTATPYIEFDEENLKEGRKIWMGTCENCHAYGVGDSPIPMEPDAWKHRIAKGKKVLYQHAIEGFFGEDDAMMPERGGNLKLSDDEVKAAVDYMVALASYYIEKAK